MKFHVTVLRTERIIFEVEADSVADAENRYLGEGDEVFSETVSTETEWVSANTDLNVTTWANGFGIWHARVPANCVSPLIAARKALRDELNARAAPGTVRREIWLKPVRVPEHDTPFTIVYREGPDGD